MCRNIKPLFNFDPPVTEAEIRDAALQFVRKITGCRVPSRQNAEAFTRAVDDITSASSRLLHNMQTTAEPKSREAEAAKRMARSAHRFN
jgi:hypothetical protein